MPLAAAYAIVIRNKNFVKLWASQIFSQTAYNILNFALVIKIFTLTGSSFWVSLVVALISVPPILLSSYAGVVADSHNRRTILITVNFLRVAVVIFFLFFINSPLAILIVALVFGIISQFFGPAETASIPEVISPKRLLTANTLFLFTVYLSFFLGYSFAGPLLFNFKEGVTFIIIAAFYFLATFANILLPSLDSHLKKINDKEVLEKNFANFKKKIFEGINFIKENKVVLFTVFQITFVFAIERSVIVLVPELAQKVLSFNVQEISYYMITPVAAGALVGSFLVNKIKKIFSKRKIINTGLIVHGTVLILISLVASHFLNNYVIPYLVILSFLSGLSDVSILVSAQTLLHEEVTAENRGRVFGNLYSLTNLVGLPFILLMGALSHIVSLTLILAILGVLTFIAAGLSWLILVKKTAITSLS